MSGRRTIIAVLAGLALASVGGCVSQEKYNEALKAQRLARQELLACRSDLAKAGEENRTLRADLTKAQCQRMAVAAHDGIGRATVPAHSPSDGDLVFSVSTGERPMTLPERDLALVGHAAALCLARAIARAIYLATPADGDLLPTWSSIPGNH